MVETPLPVEVARHARWYARAMRWRVLPLKPGTKLPLEKNWTKGASADLEQVGRWFDDHPNRNLGLATGHQSGVWVLDIDPRHGGDGSLDELLAKHGVLPPTVCQVTGGGGMQYFFRTPADREVVTRGDLRPGIDVRGEGGQVVLPPSIHPETGRAYFWDLAPSEHDLAEAPAWLIDMVCAAKAGSSETKAPKGSDADLIEGGRNDGLTRIAGRLRWAGMTADSLEAELLKINRARCRPPLQDQEVKTIARSVGRYPSGKLPAATTKPALFGGPATQGAETPPDTPAQPGPKGSGDSPKAPGPTGKWADSHAPYELNETGNAYRVLDRIGQDLRYCHTWGAWLLWNGKHWEEDKTGRIVSLMRDALRDSLRLDMERCEDEKTQADLRKWLIKNMNRRTMDNTITVLTTLPELATVADEWDAEDDVFNVANGTIDLRTGLVRPHKREDLFTRFCDVDYCADAFDQRWESLVQHISDGVVAVHDFLQRFSGYSMTGSTIEHAVLMLAGPGGTGKTTFSSAVAHILGSYARHVPFELFLHEQNSKGDWELAECQKARMLVAEESGESRRFSSEVVKKVTGGAVVSAQRKFGHPFQYTPKFKLWFVTNELPFVSDQDTGFWRRMNLVQVNKIPEVKDLSLVDHLTTNREARQAVLNWMVRGAVAYHQMGLASPAEVKQATQAYRQENNPIKDWLSECMYADEFASVSTQALMENYHEWCNRNRIKTPVTSRSMGRRLAALGLEAEKVFNGYARVRGWKGIRCRNEADHQEQGQFALGRLSANVPSNVPQTSHNAIVDGSKVTPAGVEHHDNSRSQTGQKMSDDETNGAKAGQTSQTSHKTSLTQVQENKGLTEAGTLGTFPRTRVSGNNNPPSEIAGEELYRDQTSQTSSDLTGLRTEEF